MNDMFVTEAPRHSQLLVVTWPDGRQDKHNLTKRTIHIGRQLDNDIVLHYSAIADRHLRLEVTTSGVRVSNLRTAGGVLLNNQRIPLLSPHPFLPGDVLRIGRRYLLSLTLELTS